MGESRGLSEPCRPRGSLRTATTSRCRAAPRETLGRAPRPAAGSGQRAEGRSVRQGLRADVPPSRLRGLTSRTRLRRKMAFCRSGSCTSPSEKNTMPCGKLCCDSQDTTRCFCMSGRPVMYRIR